MYGSKGDYKMIDNILIKMPQIRGHSHRLMSALQPVSYRIRRVMIDAERHNVQFSHGKVYIRQNRTHQFPGIFLQRRLYCRRFQRLRCAVMGSLFFLARTFNPFMWSECSWVIRIPSSSLAFNPISFSPCSILLLLMPASTRIWVFSAPT